MSSWSRFLEGCVFVAIEFAPVATLDMRDVAAQLLTTLPDVPCWIETRSMLRSPRVQLFAGITPMTPVVTQPDNAAHVGELFSRGPWAYLTGGYNF